MEEKKGIRAILLLAGSATRCESELPKQFHRLIGKRIYLHTLEKFLSVEMFEEILLVVPALWQREIEEELLRYPQNVVRTVIGGETRQESSRKGLLACPPDTTYVVIHDAVRPFVSKKILEENIRKAKEVGAVDTCIPSADTLVHAVDGDFITSIPPRSQYLRGQTPQSFRFSLICEAHKEAELRQIQEVSDDCRLVVELGHRVAIVPGDESNMKITISLDLVLAEQLLRKSLKIPATQDKSYPYRDLRGAKIAITGGTGGVGRVLTSLLEKEGAIPLLLSRTAPHYKVDFSNAGEIISLFQTLYDVEGPLDAIVNCMGVLHRATLHEQSEETIDAQIDLNLRGVILACKHARLKKKGQIINVASSSYSHGRGEIAVYAATKAAIVNFTQGLAQEREDLIVNVVAPSRIATEMRKSQFPEEDPSSMLSAEEVAVEIVDLLRRAQSFSSVVEIRKN